MTMPKRPTYLTVVAGVPNHIAWRDEIYMKAVSALQTVLRPRVAGVR
jgi:hypothetical protein